MIWTTISPQSCFFSLYRASPSFAAKNIINLVLVLTIWWHACVGSSLVLLCCCVAMISVFSWQSSVSLWAALFCTPRPKLPVTPGISWLPTFAFPYLWWKGHLFWVLVLEGLVGLHRTVQLQPLQHYWFGHRVGLLWYWMVCLGIEQRSFCCFWDCTQVLHFRIFFSRHLLLSILLTLVATPVLLRDSRPQ